VTFPISRKLPLQIRNSTIDQAGLLNCGCHWKVTIAAEKGCVGKAGDYTWVQQHQLLIEVGLVFATD
jgi:hypothetical protein